jgi:hypothetical protein
MVSSDSAARLSNLKQMKMELNRSIIYLKAKKKARYLLVSSVKFLKNNASI